MGEMRERMLRGELYIADDADNAAEFARVQELLAAFNGSAPAAWDERDRLLRRMLRYVGEDVRRFTASTARSASATVRSSTST